MSRKVLSELDVLDQMLTRSCYHVDRDILDDIGCVTVHKVTDECPIKAHVGYDVLTTDTYVELRENQHRGKDASLLESVTITGLHKDTLVLKPDHFMVQHFKRSTFNKACDYLILTQFQNESYALFIDLKTSIGRKPNAGKLDYRGSDYDSDMIWQMIGADALFDGLTGVVYKKVAYQSEGTVVRTKSHASDLKKCAKTPLAKYKRRYIILFLKVVAHTNTTSGGIQMTSANSPHDECLEREVCVLQVSNGGKVAIGALISCVSP